MAYFGWKNSGPFYSDSEPLSLAGNLSHYRMCALYKNSTHASQALMYKQKWKQYTFIIHMSKTKQASLRAS